MKDPDNAIVLSRNNRDKITDGVQCGCYFCIEVYDGAEIEEWADGGQTALCPKCGIDSVIPNETDKEYLTAACEHWFTGVE